MGCALENSTANAEHELACGLLLNHAYHLFWVLFLLLFGLFDCLVYGGLMWFCVVLCGFMWF